jgi:hypothetical protein
MTTVATAIAREQYELAALRLLLGVAATIARFEAAAPQARDQLVALLLWE